MVLLRNKLGRCKDEDDGSMTARASSSQDAVEKAVTMPHKYKLPWRCQEILISYTTMDIGMSMMSATSSLNDYFSSQTFYFTRTIIETTDSTVSGSRA